MQIINLIQNNFIEVKENVLFINCDINGPIELSITNEEIKGTKITLIFNKKKWVLSSGQSLFVNSDLDISELAITNAWIEAVTYIQKNTINFKLSICNTFINLKNIGASDYTVFESKDKIILKDSFIVISKVAVSYTTYETKLTFNFEVDNAICVLKSLDKYETQPNVTYLFLKFDCKFTSILSLTYTLNSGDNDDRRVYFIYDHISETYLRVSVSSLSNTSDYLYYDKKLYNSFTAIYNLLFNDINPFYNITTSGKEVNIGLPIFSRMSSFYSAMKKSIIDSPEYGVVGYKPTYFVPAYDGIGLSTTEDIPFLIYTKEDKFFDYFNNNEISEKDIKDLVYLIINKISPVVGLENVELSELYNTDYQYLLLMRFNLSGFLSFRETFMKSNVMVSMPIKDNNTINTLTIM